MCMYARVCVFLLGVKTAACVPLFLAMSDAVLHVSRRGRCCCHKTAVILTDWKSILKVLFLFKTAGFRVVFLLLKVAVMAHKTHTPLFLKSNKIINDVTFFVPFPPAKLEK